MKKLFFLCIISFILCLSFLLFQKISFNNARWLADDNVTEINKNFVIDNFSSKEELIIIFSLKQALSAHIEAINSLTNQLESINKVQYVKTPLNSKTIISDAKSINIVSFADAIKDGSLKKEDLQNKLEDSIYFKDLISKDSDKILFIISHNIADKNEFIARKNLLMKVEKIITKYSFYKRYDFSGKSFLNYSIDKENFDDLKTIFSISLLLIVAFTLIIYQNLTRVFFLFASSILCFSYTLLIFYLMDESFSILNIILPIFIIVISLSDSIFITGRAEGIFLESKQENALKEVIRATWLPCALTSITTMIGFCSFYFSEILPLKHIAFLSIPVIAGSCVIILLVNYAAIYFFYEDYYLATKQARKKSKILHYIINKSRKLIEKKYKYIVYSSFIITFIIAFGFSKIYTETNFLRIFFKDTNPVIKSSQILDKDFNGSHQIDLVLQNYDFLEIKIFKEINDLGKKLKKEESINHNASYIDIVSMVHQAFSNESLLPNNSNELSQEILFAEFSRSDKGDDLLKPYLDFSHKYTRLIVKTDNISSKEISKIVDEIKAKLQSSKIKDYFLAGNNMYFHSLNGYILETQITSFVITSLMITILILLCFGRKVAILSIIPNFLPIIITLSLISWLNIAFDFSTILIASISFGITIDSSIHLMHIYNDLLHKKSTGALLRKKLLYTIGKPMIISVVIFSLMFLIFIFSDLVLLQKFGFFGFLTIIISLLVNLLLVPSLIKIGTVVFKKS